MQIITSVENLHAKFKANRWIGYFTIFCRIALAAGFLPAGYVKIIGERFTDLHNNQPMGHYLEALHHTGYYYTFIGVLQMAAGFMLLIPPTALLGALLYFPIILNICILSLAVRFEGSLLTAPLMVIANFYLLCWDYDKLKFIFPFNKPVAASGEATKKVLSNKFPTLFFSGVFVTVILWGVIITHVYDIMPRNTVKDCKTQCDDSTNPGACNTFCESIHLKGEPLDKSLDAYHEALKKTKH